MFLINSRAFFFCELVSNISLDLKLVQGISNSIECSFVDNRFGCLSLENVYDSTSSLSTASMFVFDSRLFLIPSRSACGQSADNIERKRRRR